MCVDGWMDGERISRILRKLQEKGDRRKREKRRKRGVSLAPRSAPRSSVVEARRQRNEGNLKKSTANSKGNSKNKREK